MLKKIISTKHKKIDSIIMGLSYATDDHFKWLVRFIESLAKKDFSALEVIDEHSYNRCRFNLWLEKHKIEKGGCSEFLNEISAHHKNLHISGRDFFLALGRGEQGDAELPAFEKALLAFANSLTDYKAYLLQIKTNSDALTGLPLRNMLVDIFDKVEVSNSEGHIYILVLDIDHFKKVNDNYGHTAGDIVLRSFGARMERAIRKTERIYRFGGEEFVAMIRASSDLDAYNAAERLRLTVSDTPFDVESDLLDITVTVGLVKARLDEALESVLSRADCALYQGKSSGRNCTIAAFEEETACEPGDGRR
ncbi:TPA: diguanylate cyclase [Klebsiella variicola subsp. variicola]|nr:diguanylate cyclase [Klebsiella variicola subsp. variicola]